MTVPTFTSWFSSHDIKTIALAEIEPRELIPGFTGKFLHTDSMTLVYWDIVAGAKLPEHSHSHEQVVNVLAGEFVLTIAGVRCMS